MSYRKNETERAVTLEPEDGANAAVIWLHGLGADGNDFVPIVPELGLPETLRPRFVFPHADVRPVTINGGMAMRAWYDIKSLSREGLSDSDGIGDSTQRVTDLIAEQRADGIESSRVVVAGFSQGGAIALHAGLRHPQRLAGVLGLSTYLPMSEKLDAEAAPANRDVPLMLCHGSQDPMVPLALGSASRDVLLQAGYAPTWHEYPMQHQVCIEEIRDIGNWLTSVLGK